MIHAFLCGLQDSQVVVFVDGFNQPSGVDGHLQEILGEGIVAVVVIVIGRTVLLIDKAALHETDTYTVTIEVPAVVEDIDGSIFSF